MASTEINNLPLQGRVAIITGASRGIGRGTAIHLRSLGAKLVINYTSNSSQSHADLLTTELNSTSKSPHPVAISVKSDISDAKQVTSLFDQSEQAFRSHAHILVNCAGVDDSNHPTISNTTVQDWDHMFNVNAWGAFLCCREAVNRLKRGGGGRIIMVTTSLTGGPTVGFGAYTASKAAVEAMVKIVAKELKGSGITANCVAPGPVATDMFYAGKSEESVESWKNSGPFGRIGEPQDVANVVGFLASDASEWINGQIIRVNGGILV